MPWVTTPAMSSARTDRVQYTAPVLALAFGLRPETAPLMPTTTPAPLPQDARSTRFAAT